MTSQDSAGGGLVATQEFFSSNIVFIEELYQKFLQDNSSVDASWADFFKKNSYEIESILADYKGPSWARRSLQVVGSKEYDISTNSEIVVIKKSQEKSVEKVVSKEITAENFDKIDLNLRVANLIIAYQRYGHFAANLDPLELTPRRQVPEIDPKNHGILPQDLSKEVELNGVLAFEKATISQVIDRLNRLYTGSVGAEFEYIFDQNQKAWLSQTTSQELLSELSKEEKAKILQEIIRTEHFEQFLHKRFPGAKRFSIEGGDATIPALEAIVDVVAKDGVKKVIFGMAHRGRLNTLTGIMGKPYHQMIAEFRGTPGFCETVTRLGDVKYHMGYSQTREIDGNKIDLSLAFNPSHLEAVNSVVTGRVRATQDLLKDEVRTKALALLIHGDAAFAGQGSVAESLVLDGVKGYDTGGVIHVIVNNQIGFTANPRDSRSTLYASDLAKAIDAPIFHVNGDDVEAVVKVAKIVAKFRQKFKKDIVIDLICYRRYGHNEGDEPLYTQPLMYTKIKSHPTLETIYSKQLLEEGAITQAQYDKFCQDFDAHLSKEFDLAQDYKPKDPDWLKKDWVGVENNGDKGEAVKTSLPAAKLKEIIAKTTQVPADFDANRKILKQLEARKDAVEKGEGIDWGTAESLAFASLIAEGYPVRITGQDSGRGTFSHRHSILHDGKTGSKYNIFTPLQSEKARYEVHDSVLSEYAVLGFEYGYSLASPFALTIWEAQFGDFANGAQIIFDQFISSSEVKWLRKSGLVMLLPHGYEGQGPEHSSARLERYLQACANDNLRVCNITNPANFFHALRRQLHSKDRKPLVVMSPKSLLRHKLAVSTLSEFEKENFREILPETDKIDVKKARKVLLCSGKVYYDLYEARQEKNIDDVAIIRLEQLYPFADKKLQEELKKYENAEIFWCQEEPKNMGAWTFVHELIEASLLAIKHKNPRPRFIGRPNSASPATGYASYHAKEQKALIDEALS